MREGTAVRLSEREPLLSHAAHQGRRLELRDLERAIGKLPDAQRSVILLVGLEGMRYDEVAVVLNVPVGTSSRLSRARDLLRRLTDGVPDEENRTARLHGSDHASRHMVAWNYRDSRRSDPHLAAAADPLRDRAKAGRSDIRLTAPAGAPSSVPYRIN